MRRSFNYGRVQGTARADDGVLINVKDAEMQFALSVYLPSNVRKSCVFTFSLKHISRLLHMWIEQRKVCRRIYTGTGDRSAFVSKVSEKKIL